MAYYSVEPWGLADGLLAHIGRKDTPPVTEEVTKDFPTMKGELLRAFGIS